MRLAVDASILVSEALRSRGRDLLAHPHLDLFIAAEASSEATHELRRRVILIAQRQRLEATVVNHLLTETLEAVETAVTMVPLAVYAGLMDEARARIPRDPNDAPTLALALLMDCSIWTADLDFFGCGVAVWGTETLQTHLQRTTQV
jgi:predicted nucleic acid-binding protein